MERAWPRVQKTGKARYRLVAWFPQNPRFTARISPLSPPDESCSLCCRRDHCCRYCYDSLDQHNARGLQCTRILRARRVFVLPYRPTACVKGSQSGMVPLQIEFVVSLEHGPPQDSLRLSSEENWKSGWLLWCLDGWHRSIFGNLVNHHVFVFPQLKRGTFDRRVTYFSKRWKELGRNEISGWVCSF